MAHTNEVKHDRKHGATRRRSSLVVLAFAFTGLAWTGCEPTPDDELEEDAVEMESPAATPSPGAAGGVIHEASFQPGPGATGAISGNVRFLERNGQVELRVDLTGLGPGEHAWHIHEDACGRAGPVRYALSSTADMEGVAGALTADRDGAARRTVTARGLNRSWIGSGRYSLHIHQRGGIDHGPTVACATV